MKKILVLIAVTALLAVNGLAYATTLDLDLSRSSIAPTAQETIRIDNVTGTLNGTPIQGKYWIDFTWDPVNLVFVPRAAGLEPQATGHTWSWTVVSYSDSFQYSITSDPVNRLFYVSYATTTGTPFICPDVNHNFIQGNNQFSLRDYSYQIDDSHALITFDSAFDGCSDIYSGQTITATISDIPSWFDFTQTFAVSFGAEPMYCEPDGTAHK
jgi:hypothetical protein